MWVVCVVYNDVIELATTPSFVCVNAPVVPDVALQSSTGVTPDRCIHSPI